MSDFRKFGDEPQAFIAVDISARGAEIAGLATPWPVGPKKLRRIGFDMPVVADDDAAELAAVLAAEEREEAEQRRIRRGIDAQYAAEHAAVVYTDE